MTETAEIFIYYTIRLIPISPRSFCKNRKRPEYPLNRYCKVSFTATSSKGDQAQITHIY